MKSCCFCNNDIHPSEPYINKNNKFICYSCYVELIEDIYSKCGAGDGGFIHLVFRSCLESGHNKSRKKTVQNYKEIFKKLLVRYNYKCVYCGELDVNKLTIDHIHPKAKGGTDKPSNLQILCKSCNSRKGAKVANNG